MRNVVSFGRPRVKETALFWLLLRILRRLELFIFRFNGVIICGRKLDRTSSLGVINCLSLTDEFDNVDNKFNALLDDDDDDDVTIDKWNALK